MKNALKIIVGASLLTSVACTVKTGSNGGGSGPEKKETVIFDGATEFKNAMLKSDEKAADKMSAFVAKFKGKTLKFAGTKSSTIKKGEVAYSSDNSLDKELEVKCFEASEAGQPSVEKSCDRILELTILDEKTATEVTQTSSGKEIRTRYSLDKEGELALSLIEIKEDGSIFFKEGGTIVIEDNKVILRSKNQIFMNGEEQPTEETYSLYDRIFNIVE